MAWTDPNLKEFKAHEYGTAAEMNTYLIGNTAWLKENIELGEPTELTIESGAILITKSYHTIDTEDDAEEDELETINGGGVGKILILRAAHSDRTIILKHGIGLILHGEDIVLDNIDIHVMLIRDSDGLWHVFYCPLGY